MIYTFPRKLWFFVIFMASAKIIIASSLGLGNDEVYYWTYALKLEWNYFDHPPFVAWLIRITTLNLFLHDELAARFGAILASSICSFLIYRIGQLLSNERVGWYSVILYSCSFYCSIIAGTFILPDSPQMVFWFWAIHLFLKINRAVSQGNRYQLSWYWFGIAVGLCMLCKVHGLFLWISVILFAFFCRPKLFLDKGMYIAMAITLTLFSPVLFWNIEHRFITYTYHSERVNIFQSNLNPLAFLREISGELFYNNPIIFVLIWISVFTPLTDVGFLQKQERKIILFFGLPLIITLISLSFFRDTFPHWSGPAYACLILLSALKLEHWLKRKAKLWLTVSASFFVIVIGLGLVLVNYYPGSLSGEKRTLFLGKGDPTLDLYGWKETGDKVSVICSLNNEKSLNNIQTLVITKWFPAAHLDYYIANNGKLTTYGIGETFDLHQYSFTNHSKRAPKKGEDCLYIMPSNLFDESEFQKIKSHFLVCDRPIIIPILRGGEVCKNILIFRMKGFIQ